MDGRLTWNSKSQLAIEYAHRVAVKHNDRWIFWIHAATRARLEEGFRSIADTVKIRGRQQPTANIPELVRNWLANEQNGKWLVVLDSADDIDVFYGVNEGHQDSRPMSSYFPQSPNGSVLVTTRDRSLARRLTGNWAAVIEIGPMETKDALLLLEKRLGAASDQQAALQLVQALDHVALAISQAAGYIQAMEPRMSPGRYLHEFNKSDERKFKLLEYSDDDLRRDGSASNAILKTWQISFEHIYSRRRSAADLLSLMSFFDRQGIPDWMLRPTEEEDDEGQNASGDEDVDALGSSSSSANELDALEFEQDVKILRDFSLISFRRESNTFEMHRLVQLSTRKWLAAGGLQDTFKEQFVMQLADAFPSGDLDTWPTCRMLFAHVQVAATYRLVNDEASEAWEELLYNGAAFALQQGQYDIAEKMLRRIEEGHKNGSTAFDDELYRSRSLLGEVLAMQGRWEEAERLHVQVIAACEMKFGAHHLNTLGCKLRLGSTFIKQGRFEEVRKLQEQVMEIRKAKFGADHPEILVYMGNLALIYSSLGRLEEAEQLGSHVLEMHKDTLGADHLQTLGYMGARASALLKQGRLDEAEQLLLHTVEMLKAKLGADHPDTLSSMGSLAILLSKQGRLEEAEQLQVQVFEMSETKLGANHPDTLTGMHRLACLVNLCGRPREALDLMSRCAFLRESVLGIQHPSTKSSMEIMEYWQQGIVASASE